VLLVPLALVTAFPQIALWLPAQLYGSQGMTARTVRWKALAWQGWEHLALDVTADGVLARGALIGEREGTRYGAFYEVELTPGWVFRSISIRRTDGRGLTLRSTDGVWTDGDGRALPKLDGCIDIDLSGSPFTNTLPVRRVAFETGTPRHFSMAWIPLDSLSAFADRQIYTRLGEGRFRYQSGDGSFERVIDFDADGLVRLYPGLFEAIPP
jgi:uncharacterized protein